MVPIPQRPDAQPKERAPEEQLAVSRRSSVGTGGKMTVQNQILVQVQMIYIYIYLYIYIYMYLNIYIYIYMFRIPCYICVDMLSIGLHVSSNSLPSKCLVP